MFIKYIINVNGTVKDAYLGALTYWIFQITPCTRMGTHLNSEEQVSKFLRNYFPNS